MAENKKNMTKKTSAEQPQAAQKKKTTRAANVAAATKKTTSVKTSKTGAKKASASASKAKAKAATKVSANVKAAAPKPSQAATPKKIGWNDNNPENPNKIQLTRADRFKVWLRMWLLQAAWNFERMQNVGWCFVMLPAMRKLYKTKEDRIAFMKRHLEFFNTHPYLAAPVWGVELSLEESKANGAQIDDAAIQGTKIGMMGPLAGVGDPVFWGTLRPVLGAFAASLAISGNILGPILFFLLWNVIRMAFLWYTQEFGYQAGANISKDLSGGLLQRVTVGASVLGMFIMGVLIPRWTSVDMSAVVFSQVDMGSVEKLFPNIVGLQGEGFIDSINHAINGGASVTPDAFQNSINSLQSISDSGYSILYNPNAATQADGGAWRLMNTTTLQSIMDQLLPGLLPLALTFLCMWLLKKKVSPILIIFILFGFGILGALVGLFPAS